MRTLVLFWIVCALAGISYDATRIVNRLERIATALERATP